MVYPPRWFKPSLEKGTIQQPITKKNRWMHSQYNTLEYADIRCLMVKILATNQDVSGSNYASAWVFVVCRILL